MALEGQLGERGKTPKYDVLDIPIADGITNPSDEVLDRDTAEIALNRDTSGMGHLELQTEVEILYGRAGVEEDFFIRMQMSDVLDALTAWKRQYNAEHGDQRRAALAEVEKIVAEHDKKMVAEHVSGGVHAKVMDEYSRPLDSTGTDS